MTAADVAEYLTGLADPRCEALAELCNAVLDVDPRTTGMIKWNAPSFLITDHFATTGLNRGGGLRLVLHAGAKKKTTATAVAIDDPLNMLEWKSPDRALVTFADLADVRSRRLALQAILRQWIDRTQ